MARSRPWLLLALCGVVFFGSLIGLILALSEPAEAPAPNLSVDLVVVPEVMTSVHKVYSGISGTFLAKTIIKNNGTEPVTNVHISYSIPGYVETAGQEDYPIILPGQTVNDYCYPTFNAQQLKAIESETQAEVDVNYSYDGSTGPKGTSATFSFLGHNDWVRTYLPEEDRLTFADGVDNSAMLAAFVTKNDRDVERLAKKLTGGIFTATDDGAWQALEAIYDGIRYSPMRYVTESDAYWTADAQHVQFPAETLANERGNCVDLSVLFASLLESVGISTTLCLSTGHCQVGVTLPESGDFYVIEATAVDDASITLNNSVNLGYDTWEREKPQFSWVQVDVENEWANGMVPSW